MRCHVAVQPGIGQHAHIQRGHTHEDGGILEARHHGLRVELGKPDHGAAVEQRTVNGHKQAVHMEDGQGVDEHIVILPAPVNLQHGRIGQQIAVGQHRALAAPCGAAGVENGGQIIGPALHGLLFIAVVGGALQ